MSDHDDSIVDAIENAADPVDFEKRRRTSPVVPMGAENGKYTFLTRSGEMRTFAAKDFIPGGYISLFEGRMEWLCEQFPKRDRDGNVIDGAFHVQAATRWLMAECHDKGMLPADLDKRGLGVWKVRGAAGPDVVVHVGDAVWYRGRWERPGLRLGKIIFVARPPCAKPDFKAPADAKVGALLLEALRLWNFEHRFDADLILGYIGATLLGTHPSLRTHILLSSVPGGGKSTMVDLIAAALGDQATRFDDTSEAGMRNSMGDEARGALLDEAESNSEHGGPRIHAVIELIRRMSTGTGARIVRADVSGGIRSTTVAAAAFLAAVNPPPLAPQDRSRIHRVELRRRAGDPKTRERVLKAVEWAATVSEALRGRAVLRAGLFHEIVPLYRAELINRGCDDRTADKFATLFAGRDILLHDDPPHGDAIDHDVTTLEPVLLDTREADEEESDASACWNFLLTATPDWWRMGVKATVGNVISRLRTTWNDHDAAMLASIGVRLVKAKGDEPEHVLVANQHNQLNKLFHTEKSWQRGGWATSLARLGEGVQRGRKGWFGGRQSRALLIPAAYLPAPADEATGSIGEISSG